MAFISTQSLNSAPIRCLFLLIVLIGCCASEFQIGGDLGEALGHRLGKQQRDFDYFQLALQWPGTYCRRTRHCCASNGCCRGSNSPAEFTIHGLWPDYNDGTWPSCCTGKKFNAKEISTLLDDLNKYWPSLSCGSPKNCHGGKGLFWEHEWEKHGTCSASVTGDEYNYFVTVLKLYSKYNVTEALRDAGYVASNTEKYPLGGVITAIQNAFHTTPEIECSGDAIEELNLCFYKDFKPRDCAVKSNTRSGIITSKKSCPDYVSLPEYVSLKLPKNRNEVSESTLESSI